MPSGSERVPAEGPVATREDAASAAADVLATQPAAVAGPRARRKSVAREALEAFAAAILISLFVRTFVVQAFKIPSGSMLPTLQVGDHILVNKFVYGVELPVVHARLFGWATPRRGDVVVFVYPVDPSKDFIKRVVAVGGDVVEIRSKHVYINGQPWKDSHAYFVDGMPKVHAGTRDNYGPATVPPGQVFVLGDNRDRSYDSRFWGFVDVNAVKGRAFLVYWSWSGRQHGVRWSRLGHVIE